MLITWLRGVGQQLFRIANFVGVPIALYPWVHWLLHAGVFLGLDTGLGMYTDVFVLAFVTDIGVHTVRWRNNIVDYLFFLAKLAVALAGICFAAVWIMVVVPALPALGLWIGGWLVIQLRNYYRRQSPDRSAGHDLHAPLLPTGRHLRRRRRW